MKIILSDKNPFNNHARANSEYNIQPNRGFDNPRGRSQTHKIEGLGAHQFGGVNRRQTLMTYQGEDIGSPVIQKFNNKNNRYENEKGSYILNYRKYNDL